MAINSVRERLLKRLRISPDPHHRRRQLLGLTASIVTILALALAEAHNGFRARPYHTSKFRGADWVRELLRGHPQRIKDVLGVQKHVFLAFRAELVVYCGLRPSRGISVDEQVAIFLYMVVTNLPNRQVAERFQRSGDTISRYVHYVAFLVFCLLILLTLELFNVSSMP